MKIIKLSQTEDREQWLDMRRTIVTGTKAKLVKPKTRGSDLTPSGFWELLAENLAVAKDGEPERDRGNRLERDGIKLLAKKYKLKFDDDPGFWLDDRNPKIGVSPDGAEPGGKPTYAAEVKCLDSKNHLRIMVSDMRANKEKGYNPLNSLKLDYSLDFEHQAIQYFVVNNWLDTLYFTLYDDRMAFDHLMLYVIKINRTDVAERVLEQRTQQEDILKEVSKLAKELANV